MNYKNFEKNTENSTVSFQVEVDSAAFEKAVAVAYQKNKKDIFIQGFRKGKAPRQVIEGMYGKDVFYDDAVNEIAYEAFELGAKEAGADYVGEADLAQKIQQENWFDFDVVIASPDMMSVVGRLGKVLGPKGLMPSPKAGTVTPNVTQAVNEIKAGKVEYRLDKTNIIHCPIGKVSFGPEKLSENFAALMGAIIKAKPAAAKGQYIKSCTVAATMGPGVKVNGAKLV